MTKNILATACCILLAISLQTCKTSRKVMLDQIEVKTIVTTQTETGLAALPRCLVYKTRGEYADNVPVLLNAEKTAIVSYPAPTDISTGGKLAYPSILDQGYLLDNRGIAPNVAFLRYSYEEYSSFKKTPGAKELYKKIIDKYPLIELWDCGTRTQENCKTERLNKLIKEGFPGCKALLVRLEAPSL